MAVQDAAEPARRRITSAHDAAKYIEEEILRRKILVTPYKGDVKRLFDLFLVELVESLMQQQTPSSTGLPKFLHDILWSPVGRAAT
eukprot:CAMPEP_0198569416 /NCGR_PEP_ID=MMETSP1462-20131121/107780_1 /TAXON_ID=1333877 /ORGANISM="Brandtodinium nutriculum, Strain RCC3387" /LENGTH=85 /DNA_ID=CAMNT_0044300509 /DNA_START=39 /DNA_END=292 /DNA_ORIENTATION=+